VPNKREFHINLWYFIVATLAIVAIQDYVASRANLRSLTYSEFLDRLQNGDLDQLVVAPDQITGELKASGTEAPAPFVTQRVDPALAGMLSQAKVIFSGAPGPGLLGTVLTWLMPTLLFVGVWYVLIRPMSRMGDGLLAIGKSKAKIYMESDVSVHSADVAGVDEAKQELAEIVEFLKAPKQYGRLGAHVPKGVLLVGPPGTGKTLLARAVAGEAGVPFFSISGSSFVEMFVGVGAARVRDLFEQARARAPSIIFIDELDSLGRSRFAGLTGGPDEKEQTLNQLLAELDGFDPTSGVVLLAATNRPEILDPALLRAGRFDRQVLVDRPDRKGRIDILKLHLKKVMLDPAVRPEEVAAMTPGFTGADLANLVNEAALLATRRGAASVTAEDFTVAIERIIAGLEKRSRLLSQHEREVVAHHEMGHAITAMALPDVDKPHKVSIIPHGIAALGYTMQRPAEDRFLMVRSELVDRMVVLFGGRAAEALIFNEISTGAADDLARATDIARSMVVRFGMDAKLGQAVYEPQLQRMIEAPPGLDLQPRHYGEQTAAAIDVAIRDLLDDAYVQAWTILRANRSLLKETSARLLEHESLSADELDEIARKVRSGKCA
jgi:cell division protease FtsH